MDVSVPLTLLGLLEREPSHGYDLKRDYDAFSDAASSLPPRPRPPGAKGVN